MSAHDGGPAFPCERERGERLDSAPGMTLRDYFAAHASEEDIRKQARRIKAIPDDSADWRSLARYMHADAMLKERAK